MDFLFEIGLEEVPARMLAVAEAELLGRTLDILQRASLVGTRQNAVSYSTPRRLAVLVPRVFPKQNDSFAMVLGPSVKIAYKGGIPGPAAEAFARKNGLTVAQLKIESTDKGDYLLAETERKGRTASEILAAELPKELAAIYWAKNMYWRAGKPERFVRPVRWMVALLGSEVLPVAFGGQTASNLTYGHRILNGPEPIAIAEPADYVSKLEAAFVMADVEQRRHTIRKALDRVCRAIPNTRWREDHALVDKMTHMTEWPSVIAGNFEPEYLTLPEEVLVTVMRDHQNYFAVESPTNENTLSSFAEKGLSCFAAGGGSAFQRSQLAPHFLAVLNTVPTPEAEQTIRHGNERVLRARFNDARFFWDFDQRIPLTERVALLENVTFQKDLGSYAAKSERVGEICKMLGSLLIVLGAPVDLKALEAAATLAKTDLTTELVKEFTELQGEVGGLYARAQGIPEATAAAIYDHYRPESIDAAIPRTVAGQILAIADKTDTIAGMFSLGMEPTGSRDPFALRRAANGIVTILAESTLPFGLAEVVFVTQAPEPVTKKMSAFFAERLDFYLREAKSQAYDVVKAVLAVGADDVRDAIARAEAVTAVRGSEDFAAVSAALKRSRNILTQATEKGIVFGTDIAGLTLTSPAEEALVARTIEVQNLIAPMRPVADYVGALEAIATIRPEIDRFFDSVMVMDPDETVRYTRLTILNWIQQGFSGIADFSEIVTAG
jgi:glycyl-tRNA synthetase beta chain